jgi:hypothetical protein
MSGVPDKLTVDLHPVFRSDQDIALAVRGKGSGKLKGRVLAMLKQPHVKKLYRRVEMAPGNDGMVLVHLR